MQTNSGGDVDQGTGLKVFVDQLPDGMIVHHQGRILHVNTALLRMLGYQEAGELVGRPGLDLVHPDDRRLVVKRVGTLESSGHATLPLEQRLLRKDGSVVPVEAFSISVVFEGQPAAMSILHEISTLKEAQRALLESEAKYRHLFQGSPLPILIYDFHSLAILDANDMAVKTYGYGLEEWRHMTLRDLFPPQERSGFDAFVPTREVEKEYRGVSTHQKKDGSLFQVEVLAQTLARGSRVLRSVILRDLTQQLKAEAELRQAQKMETVGLLAGGVAHDFNNILTVILANNQFLTGKLEASSPLRARAEEIKKAGERAAELTRQLLAFSSRQILQPRVLDINQVVEGMAGMLRRLIGENIELRTELEAGGLAAMVDAGQLEQVLMNLAVNARDAMPQGGKLLIQTRRQGERLCLSVADNGHGMDAKTMASIFEPFFTTKPKGKGTGLGLSTVYGIIKQSKGEIQVESQPGQGACFKVWLPLVEGQARPPAAQARQAAPAPAPGECAGVLLVEDNDAVRAVVGEMLRDAGYPVFASAHGNQALDLFRENQARVQVLLSDVVMPGMNGKEVALALRALQPGIKVILMSGYTDQVSLQAGQPLPGSLFLQKPFAASALLSKMDEVLQAPNPKP